VADIPDEILMQKVKDGNLAEMSVLFERYHLNLYNFFLKLTMKKEISQDLTQNLFYRMIKYKHTYNDKYSVKSWIYKIAWNLHADYCRGQKKSESLFMKIDTYPAEVSEDNDGYPEEDYQKLEIALSSLSDEQREIIILSRYQGLKYEEISTITNQSVPAIKVAVYRAIKQLRMIFSEQI
jgi:RNA polymerase sigma factor (sigma-70 family)